MTISQREWLPVRAETLADRIVDRVKDALFAGDLAPGDRLGTEASLAASFGVSRITVRDALRSLEALGILDIRLGSGGGAFVARGNPARLSDALAVQFKLVGLGVGEIIDSQLALESGAIDLAMRNATADDYTELRALVAAMSAGWTSAEAFNDTALEFHRRLVAAAHNRFLDAQFSALAPVLRPLLGHRTTEEVASRVAKVYATLVGRMETGDHQGARAMLVERLNAARERELSGQG